MAFFDKLSEFTQGFSGGFSPGLQIGSNISSRRDQARRADESLQLRKDKMERERFNTLYTSDPSAAIAQARAEGNQPVVDELTLRMSGQTGKGITDLMGAAMEYQSTGLAEPLGTEGRYDTLAADMTESFKRNSAVNRYVQQRFGNEKDPRGWETFMADEDFHRQNPHIKGLTDNYRSMGVDIYKDMSTSRERELHYSDLYAQAAYLASQASQGEYEKARDDAAGLFENSHRASAFIARLDNMRRDSVKTTVLEIVGRSKTIKDVDVAAAYETDDPIAQVAVKAAYRAAELNQLKEVGYGMDLLSKAVDADVAGDVGEMESYLELYNDWAEATDNDTIDVSMITERSHNQSSYTLLNKAASELTTLRAKAHSPISANDQHLIDEHTTALALYNEKTIIGMPPPTAPKISANAREIFKARSRIDGLLRTHNLPMINFATNANGKLTDEGFAKLLNAMVSSDLEIRGLSGANGGMSTTAKDGETDGSYDSRQMDSASGGRSLGPMAEIIEGILSTTGITEAEARQEFSDAYEQAAKSETKEDMAKWWHMVQSAAGKMGLNVGSAPGNLEESAGDLFGPILPLPDGAENFFGPPNDPAAARESVPDGILSPDGRPSLVNAAPSADTTAVQPQVPPVPTQQVPPPPTEMGGRDLNAPPQIPDILEVEYYPGRADDVGGWKDGLTNEQVKEVIAATKEIKAPVNRFTEEDFHETRELLFPRDPGPYPSTILGSEWLERKLTPRVRQPTNTPISRSR